VAEEELAPEAAEAEEAVVTVAPEVAVAAGKVDGSTFWPAN